MFRVLQQTVFIIILILILSTLPTIIDINPIQKNLTWNFELFPQIFIGFFHELANGSLGTYEVGSQIRFIEEDIAPFFQTSLFIMLVGVNVGVVFSILFGIFVSRFRLTRLVNIFLNILAVVPDFIIIILSLLAAVKFYKLTGIRVISLRPDSGALNIWFPTLLVALPPTLYMFKLIAVQYFQLSGEDFIKTAVSKGLSLNYINFQHVFKNIEPYILAELTKVISLAIGNLFIVEYLLNVSGITKFVFLNSQFQPITIGLFAMLIISFIVYMSVRIGLYLFKRGFIYE